MLPVLSQQAAEISVTPASRRCRAGQRMDTSDKSIDRVKYVQKMLDRNARPGALIIAQILPFRRSGVRDSRSFTAAIKELSERVDNTLHHFCLQHELDFSSELYQSGQSW